MSPKIGDGFFIKKLCPQKFSGTDLRDSTMSPIVITLFLRLIFTYDYTPPKLHFSTRIPIACQLYEHAYKLLQKSFEVAQRPSHEPSHTPPATRQLIN